MIGSKLIRKIMAILITIIFISIVFLFLLINYRDSSFRKSEDLFNDGKGGEAVNLLVPFARVGDGHAQSLLGYAYAYGWGDIKISDALAIYWFRRCGACEPGMVLHNGEDPAAPHELIVSKVYASGEQAIKADLGVSKKWLVRAANGGNREARFLLANPVDAIQNNRD